MEVKVLEEKETKVDEVVIIIGVGLGELDELLEVPVFRINDYSAIKNGR